MVFRIIQIVTEINLAGMVYGLNIQMVPTIHWRWSGSRVTPRHSEYPYSSDLSFSTEIMSLGLLGEMADSRAGIGKVQDVLKSMEIFKK